MTAEWKTPLRKGFQGEAGVVYYLTYELIFPDKEAWTKSEPFTVNPEAKVTIDNWIMKATDLNFKAKAELMRERRAELKDRNNVVLRLYITTKEAPYTWGGKELNELIKKGMSTHGSPSITI